MNKKKTSLITILALLFWGNPISATPDNGITDILEMCADCHGADGASTENDIPTIGGMSAFVIEDYLLVYQENGRPCIESEFRGGDLDRPATDMCKIAAELSEAQIAQLGEFFAGKEFVRATQEFNAGLAAQGKAIHDRECEKCHSDDGSYPDDDTSILAGQWMPYLEQAFDEYNSGERYSEEKMKEKLDKLDATQIEALVHFYGSKQ